MTSTSIQTVEVGTRPAEALAPPISAAFRDLGFVALRDHGVDPQLIERAYAASRAFFALPLERKLRYHLPSAAGARGYTPFGVEKAKDQGIADLKEFWHVGRELPPSASPELRAAAALMPNLWAEEIPDFRAATQGLYEALDALGARMLSAVALGLGLDARYFERVVDHGNSILRPLHYPPLPPSAAGEDGDASTAGAVRSAAHEDINLITLLVASAEPGLQILSRAGSWIDAPVGEDLIICNVGDMLQRLTNHVLPSTTHRVINPPAGRRDVSRYSIPFFLHPNSDFLIETLPGCIDSAHPNRYPEPILADDYLKQRLREIGLM